MRLLQILPFVFVFSKETQIAGLFEETPDGREDLVDVGGTVVDDATVDEELLVEGSVEAGTAGEELLEVVVTTTVELCGVLGVGVALPIEV